MQKKQLIIIFFIIVFTFFCYNNESNAAVREIDLPVLSFAKTQIFPGDYLVFYLENIKAEDDISLTTALNNTETSFFDYANGKIGLFSVHYSTSAGNYPVYLRITRAGRMIFEQEQTITLMPKTFSTQHLQVSKSLEAKRDEKLLELDAINTDKAKSYTENKSLWKDNFVIPLIGRISTEYGLVRYINNVISGRHTGIDIAAPRGTSVIAANSGIVNFAQKQYVTGNTVIIDHGLGVYSSYAHLNKILVEQGERIEKGQIIGQVGSTGFSTGPHLHWTISIGKTFVNPWLFLEEDPLAWISPQDK